MRDGFEGVRLTCLDLCTTTTVKKSIDKGHIELLGVPIQRYEACGDAEQRRVVVSTNALMNMFRLFF